MGNFDNAPHKWFIQDALVDSEIQNILKNDGATVRASTLEPDLNALANKFGVEIFSKKFPDFIQNIASQNNDDTSYIVYKAFSDMFNEYNNRQNNNIMLGVWNPIKDVATGNVPKPMSSIGLTELFSDLKKAINVAQSTNQQGFAGFDNSGKYHFLPTPNMVGWDKAIPKDLSNLSGLASYLARFRQE